MLIIVKHPCRQSGKYSEEMGHVVGAFLHRLALAILLVAILVGTLTAAPSSGEMPGPGIWFEYDFNTYTDQGDGDYSGYWDEMKSHSRYEISAIDGDNVTVHRTGSWSFRASDGTFDSASFDATFFFNATSRAYNGPYDVDGVYVNPIVWFWVSTPLAIGEDVPIIDDVLTVRALDDVVWFGLLPKAASRLESDGMYRRNDAYGQFDATYTDRYWFARDTGFIVAERYEERDVAVDLSASFRWRAEVFVTASSYEVPLHLPTFLAVDVGIPMFVIAACLLAYRRRRGPWRMTANTPQGKRRIVLRRVRKPDALQNLKPGGSKYFTPFLPMFARRALASNDPAVLATDDDRIVGLFIHDRESNVGSLFAEDEAVALSLSKRIRVNDFFAEDKLARPDKPFDTFLVLELRDPKAATYDVELVRPMTGDDIPSVTAIAETAYQGKAKQWIRSSYEDGDLAFVAVHGKVVGFGFATVADGAARLHTLTVLSEFRARGIGSEIMAARLATLAALGVERVIVEISMHNAASLRVAYKFGFQEIGRTTYYSRSREGAAFPWQRRF